jgi:hypothetical protein
MHVLAVTDCRRPTLAASLRAPTTHQASKRASPTPTPTTARKSPSRMTRAKRAKVLLRLPSSRAPSRQTVLERRTRKSAARPRSTRTNRVETSTLPRNHLVFYSTQSATIDFVESCIIICESEMLIFEQHALEELNFFSIHLLNNKVQTAFSWLVNNIEHKLS